MVIDFMFHMFVKTPFLVPLPMPLSKSFQSHHAAGSGEPQHEMRLGRVPSGVVAPQETNKPSCDGWRSLTHLLTLPLHLLLLLRCEEVRHPYYFIFWFPDRVFGFFNWVLSSQSIEGSHIAIIGSTTHSPHCGTERY